MKKLTISMTALMLATSACTPKAPLKVGRGLNLTPTDSRSAVDLVISGRVRVTDTTKELYVEAAEGVLAAEADIEAVDEVLARVLEVDSQHAKANFLKAFTQPVRALKGVVHRMKMLPFWQVGIRSTRKNLESRRTPKLSDLLLNSDHGKGMTNERDVQDFLRLEMMPELKTSLSRLEIAEKSGEEIAIWVRGSGGSPTLLDSLDLKAAQAMVRSGLDGLRLYTAWDLKGMQSFLKYMSKKRTDKQIIAKLESMPEFLTLRSDNELGEIRNSLEATIQAGMDLEAMHEIVCKSEDRDAHLFRSICIGQETLDDLAKTLTILQGDVLEAGSYGMGTVVVAPMAWITSPPKDLKEFVTSSNVVLEGNRFASFKDPKFGGLFPNGDPNENPRATAKLLEEVWEVLSGDDRLDLNLKL